jgi:hypothetical protein
MRHFHRRDMNQLRKETKIEEKKFEAHDEIAEIFL